MSGFGFQGKRALVTGASRGIGFDVAQKLANGGAQVVLLARSEEKVTAAATKCGNGAKSVTADLLDPASLRSAVQQAVELLGGLDVLVISGGNGGSEYLGTDPESLDSYKFLHQIHVEATLTLVQEAQAALAESKGNVVVVSSLASDIPWPQTLPYNTAKGAQHTLIKNLALKYIKHGIRVNCVLPACIHTEALDIMAAKMGVTSEAYAAKRGAAHPMQRCGSTEEVSNAALFLASPMASFICGHFLVVDGGLALTNWFNTKEMMSFGKASE